jgi:hypothetical protein
MTYAFIASAAEIRDGVVAVDGKVKTYTTADSGALCAIGLYIRSQAKNFTVYTEL